MNQESPILSARGISKRYGGVKALDHVDIDLYPGKIVALIGENGAGKSTLVKVISGAVQPDAGTIFIEGNETRLNSVPIAQELGIRVIHQVPALALDLTVLDNVFLGSEIMNRRWPPVLQSVNYKSQVERLAPVLERFAPGLNPNMIVRNLKANEQRIVGIIKALTNSARVLILDEPTAALPTHEREQVIETVRELGSQGLAICYVSHYLEEVEQIADEVVVLRDGQRINYAAPSAENGKMTAERMMQLMLGQAYQQLVSLRSSHHATTSTAGKAASKEPLAHIQIVPPPPGKDVTAVEAPISLEVQSGEIVVLTGLVGSGVVEVVETIFGARPGWQAIIQDEKGQHRVKDPNSAIGLGIGYLSDDRIGESIIPDLSIRMNVSIASLKKLTRFLGLMNQKREKQEVLQLNDQLRVRRSNDEQRITELSGGNQQKVMIGRWLFTGSRFLVFNEPTQGIDVLAKSEVIQLLSEFAAAGNSVLILTTNDEEFLPIASRVLVMQHGKIVAELRGGQITHEAVVDAMILRLISHGSNHTIRGETA